ncbi:metallophosphoesterase family protein [Limnoglobus roseus]|uniref:Nuclease SbcCD subunit D n=1 Tax=Limnoglobus roseus TaxID=2598579 RepID=A0A5C1A4U7_9BACT|nr:exonuclease subunit SbcD [Limnoglobus roseus]QEL13335.1 ATP-dependent dsDNA exonuclease [Limnoglobus roseus]
MRIIHTADWHLCDRLGRLDRTADLQARVEVVAKLCDEHTADVLLIAGDVFSEQASVDDMTRALEHVRKTFAPFFRRGGTILAVTGNHDRDGRINMVRAGMTLAAPDAGADGTLAGGRMYLLNGRAVTTLKAANGKRVQFVLVPYPFPSRYELSAADYRSKEEENRLLHAKVAEWIRTAATDKKFDVTLPTVLTAHLHVRGSEAHGLYKMSERDDVLFDFADLNPSWAYVALGHIHKPQALGGAANVRYPGSLDRLDFGDTHDDHGVLLLEIDGPNAVVPTRLPIPGTPFHSITITDAETELPTLAEKYPDFATAIVRVTVTPGGSLSRDDITRQLRKQFPRLHDLRWADAGTPSDAPAKFTPRAGFETTVRDYLTEQLDGDPDREAVLALAETYLKDAGEA